MVIISLHAFVNVSCFVGLAEIFTRLLHKFRQILVVPKIRPARKEVQNWDALTESLWDCSCSLMAAPKRTCTRPYQTSQSWIRILERFRESFWMGVSNSDLAFGCGRKLEDSSEDCGHSFASGPRIVRVYKRGPNAGSYPDGSTELVLILAIPKKVLILATPKKVLILATPKKVLLILRSP